MIRIGEVHCHGCGDAFEPEGIPSFDGPNWCSDECETRWAVRESEDEAYWMARNGGASVW
jgi:hypothetical protein